MNLVAQAKARNPLPEGTAVVAAGLLVAGLSAYGFLTVSSRVLGPERYAPLATFWALLFISGPGFFMPLEQEVGRALAARRARQLGGRPVILRAGLIGVVVACCLVVVALAFGPPLSAKLFDNNIVLFIALILGLVAYLCEHLSRGMLAGNHRFDRYSLLLGSEGVLRVMACFVFGFLGIRTAGPYGIALVLASFVAVGLALVGQRGLLTPGPVAPWSEVSTALGFLLVTSVLTQFILNVGPVAVKLLAHHGEEVAAGKFLNGLVIARIPLFLFQAVVAAMLPKLSRLVGLGHFHEFQAFLLRLLGFVIALGVVGTVGAFALGPWVVRFLFGPGFDLSHSDLGLLAGASALLMIAMSLTQALISLSAYPRAAASWIVGCIAFIGVTALVNGLYLRVELGLLAGATSIVATSGALLVPVMRHRTNLTHAEEPAVLSAP